MSKRTICAQVDEFLLKLCEARPSVCSGAAEGGGCRAAELHDAQVAEAHLWRRCCQQLR